jgi:hypothetical protein
MSFKGIITIILILGLVLTVSVLAEEKQTDNQSSTSISSESDNLANTGNAIVTAITPTSSSKGGITKFLITGQNILPNTSTSVQMVNGDSVYEDQYISELNETNIKGGIFIPKDAQDGEYNLKVSQDNQSVKCNLKVTIQ